MALLLIADDVGMARDALGRLLRDHGHRVIVVADGEEALARYQKERPDAVILDVNMPRQSGPEACLRIKALAHSYTPVILMSARTDTATKVAALAAADDFVAKPYDPQELCARVEAHLRTRRMFEERRGLLERSVALVEGEAQLLSAAAFGDRLVEEWRRAARSNEPLSVMLVACGSGADVPSLAATLRRVLRQADMLARNADDQLGALLPGTHVTGALVAAERFKRELDRQQPDGLSAAVSLGIACYPGRDVSDGTDLLQLAARALERAREEGPGHICLYQHQGYLFQPEP